MFLKSPRTLNQHCFDTINTETWITQMAISVTMKLLAVLIACVQMSPLRPAAHRVPGHLFLTGS